MITWDNAVVLDERPWPGGPEPLCQEVALVEIIAGGAVASLVVKDVQEAYLEADEGKMEQVGRNRAPLAGRIPPPARRVARSPVTARTPPCRLKPAAPVPQVCNEIEFHGDRVTLRQCRSLGIVPLLHACTKGAAPAPEARARVHACAHECASACLQLCLHGHMRRAR
jgi:hypothetical protein